jgi:hypothetical protein
MSSPTVRYSLARLGLFLGALGLLYLLGARGFLLLATAIVLSGIVSYFLLTAPRVAMGMRLAGAWRSFTARIDRQARAEDDAATVPPVGQRSDARQSEATTAGDVQDDAPATGAGPAQSVRR